MPVNFVINNCFECPNWDHSGGFTPGGAIPLCNGKLESKNGYCGRKLPFSYDPETGKRVGSGKIPKWCPLKKGKKNAQK